MLKVGRKNLYLFDKNGDNKQYQPLCILDFYIHESQQRKGYGKKLYQYMLQVDTILNMLLRDCTSSTALLKLNSEKEVFRKSLKSFLFLN